MPSGHVVHSTEGMVVTIDAHCHVWRLGHNGCVWPPAGLAAIHRDCLLDEWQAQAHAVGVHSAMLVQSQPNAQDTAWLLALARDDVRVAGVVGWTDLGAADAPQRIAALAAETKLRGLRAMLDDLPDARWMLDPALTPAITAMRSHDLCLDVLVRVRHLPHLVQFAKRHRDLKMVVDHAAKPAIARGACGMWRQWMAELAELPNVFCKLSGLATEAEGKDLRPYVRDLLGWFGPQRLLWGSDWPVLNLAGDYAGWWRLADALTGLAGPERAALFGGNAARVYGIHV